MPIPLTMLNSYRAFHASASQGMESAATLFVAHWQVSRKSVPIFKTGLELYFSSAFKDLDNLSASSPGGWLAAPQIDISVFQI